MASPDDILTTLKNVVVAINGWTQATLFTAGQSSFFGITSPTLVKSGQGKIVSIIVTATGSTTGAVYDATNTSTIGKPLYIITNSATGVQTINAPYKFGLVIVPGTSQTLAGVYS